MADKRIQDLPSASSVGTADLLVLEQGGAAKNVTGQILIRDLAAALDGHGGIASITYAAPVPPSLAGTLTITTADGDETVLQVTNGNGITGISSSGTGLTKTYTLSFDDGSSYSFPVSDGVGISNVTSVRSGDTVTYTIHYSDGTDYSFDVSDGVGIDSVSASKAGLVTTVLMAMTDGTDFSFPVSDGVGIVDITWETSGVPGDGMIHTGTVVYSDGSTGTITVQDGVRGYTGPQSFVWIKWANVYPTDDSDISDTVGPFIGIYSGTDATPPTDFTAYAWYEYKGAKGDAGSSVQSIELTSSSGLIDVYTITMTDGVTGQFSVTNGRGIVSITQISGTHAAGTTDVYEILFNDGDTTTFSVYNGTNGTGSVSTVSGIQADGNGDVPQVIAGNGPPTVSTVGQTNQLYYDLSNSVLYYCAGESGGTYSWLGAGVTVDASLSTSSTNPVQNKVITQKVGTSSLNTTAQNLSDAVNEVLTDIPAPASSAPGADVSGGAVGTGTTWARADHKHALNVDSTVPEPLGTASAGTASTYAKRDHVHKKPTASELGVVDIMHGTALTTGQNLNALGFGVYYSQTGTISDSLVNCPTGAGFRLECKQTISSSDRRTQIIYTNENAPKIFIRTMTSAGWNSWYRVSLTAV